jgi:hypothetical protein
LPELIAFYEDHAAHRDKFEILAIHDNAVKSFKELDQKLVRIRKEKWQGKDLPFPILLDGNNKTHTLYGIKSWPTSLLIDPNGKLVGEIDISTLEAKLPPLTAGKKWARYRDMQQNVFWTFEPNENTLQQFADMLKRWAKCDISIDADAVKATGLAADKPLPGVLIGSSITLRSIDALLLAPHGLGLAPSADGKALVIAKRQEAKEPLSYFQKLHAEQLNRRLDSASSEDEAEKAKPLDLKDRPLLEAIKLVGREFDLPVALDAKAMHTARLDPEAKVSGRIDPSALRKSLVKMLEPLGLTVEIRHEALLVKPKHD